MVNACCKSHLYLLIQYLKLAVAKKMSKNIFSKEKYYSRIAFELIIVLLISFLICLLILSGNFNLFSFNRNGKAMETSQKLTDLEISFGDVQGIIDAPRFSRNTKTETTVSSSSIDEHIFKSLHPKSENLIQSTQDTRTNQDVVFQSVNSNYPHSTSLIEQPFTKINWSDDLEKRTDNNHRLDHIEEIIDQIFPSESFIPSEPIMWEGSGGYVDEFENYRPVPLIFPDNIINESKTVSSETKTEKSQLQYQHPTTEYFLNAETFKRPYRQQDHKHYFEIFDTDFSTTESSINLKNELMPIEEHTTIPTEIIELSYYINRGKDHPLILEQTATPKNLEVQNYEIPNEKNNLFESQLYNHETTPESMYADADSIIKKPVKYLSNFVEQDSNQLNSIVRNDRTDEDSLQVAKNHLLSPTVKPFHFFFKDFHKPISFENHNFWNIFKPKFFQNNDMVMSQSKPRAIHWHPFLNALNFNNFLPQEINTIYELDNHPNVFSKGKNSIVPFESQITESTIQEMENFPNFVDVNTDRQSPLSKLVHLFDESKLPCRNHRSLFRFK